MTLEDFFSLTEMNNGLETPLRIQELVAVMRKEKDVNGSITDATKQWSAVATTIAATDNKDCLQLFAELDGLNFLDNWLTKAHKCFDDSSDDNCSIEESITVLLRAVEKLLHVGNEELASSGIRVSVQKLLGHTSSKVQEMAKSLIDQWKKGEENASASADCETCGGSVNPGEEKDLSGSPSMDVHPSNEGFNSQDRDKNLPSLRSDEETSDKILQFVNSSWTKHISSDGHDEEEESTKLLPPEDQDHGNFNEVTENYDGGLKSRQKPRSPDCTTLSPSAELGKESGSENHCKSPALIDEDLSDQSEDDLPFGKLYMGNKDTTDILGKKSDFDLDPLDVAMQVAMEVGREFEQSCISPKKTPKFHEESPSRSPIASETEKQCETPSDSSNKGGGQEEICHPLPDEDKHLNNSETNETQDLESEKGICDFDLNQDVISEMEESADHPESDGGASEQMHGGSHLDFDLNVTEESVGIDPRCMDLNIKQDMPAGPWVEDESSSSVEEASGSKIQERLELDLNRITDVQEEGEEVHPSSTPSFLDIDLNENFTNPQSAVSIMGMRVNLNQNQNQNQKESLLPHPHPSPGYDHYNGFTPPIMPFSSMVYGHAGSSIPYMMDFRGVPVLPQIMNPASSSFPQQQPFFIPLGSGALMMPSRNGFDLNMATASQPSSQPSTSLSIGGKRKEPDGGWGEPYPFDINRRQAPWK